MTTSIDPSVDELLSIQENHCYTPNFVVANVKPIGAERKIGQLLNTPNPFASLKALGNPTTHNNNHYSNPYEMSSSSSTSVQSDRFRPYSTERSIVNELDSLSHCSFHHQSARSSSQLLDNYNNQRQAVFTRQPTVNPLPSFRVPQSYATSRFVLLHSSPLNPANPFSNICSKSRSIPPSFVSPLQGTRERFQVNSIGRPILRTNTYVYLPQAHGLKTRR